MLEILVLLARRHVERKTAVATAIHPIFVSTNVDQVLVARGICAFLVQRQKDCRVVKSPENQKYTREKRDAAIAAGAEYESLHSNVDNSSRAKANALALAITNLTVEIAAINAKNPGHDITASIFVASEGRGHLVLHEGRGLSFGSKKQGSIVKLEHHDGATYWRILDPNERKFIGPDAVDIYDATTSKIIANHVEWQVQLHVRDVLPDNGKLLQVKPGSGGCQGLPPYKVGARFIVHKQDGNLPLGAILKSKIPPGTAHISEKSDSKMRLLKDFFS